MLQLQLLPLAVPLPKPAALTPGRALHAADNLTVTAISKAERDKRRYRGIQLSNGLRTVLVSDPDAEMTAASVDVHVGSWSDPDDLPGLAHFCEHMLFMSSTKYPKEDGYAQFLESNGGGSNAFTASTHTNYFFAVQPSGLREAMDRLAQFFISPILVEDQVGREVLAVNAENDKNQQSDGWRKDQLLRSLASKGHPYHKFGTGSNVTLNVPNITGRLSEWYHFHYGVHVMTLAVVGNQPLDTLQKWAESSFAAIPGRNATVPQFDEAPRPFPAAEMPRAYLVRPVLHSEELSVAFSLPGVEKAKASLPLDFLSHLLGHEAEGSLTNLLTSKGWAQDVWAGADEAEADMTLFTVDVSLSDEGVKNWDSVLALVFESVHAAAQGVKQATFDDLQKQQSLAFEFADVSSPDDYAVSLSSNAQLYWPPQELLRGPAVASFYDRDLVLKLLDLLKPANMLVLLTSTSLTAPDKWEVQGMSSVGERLTESWYSTQYQQLEFGSNLLSAVAAAAKNNETELLPPRPNPYMPTSFDMLDPDALPEGETTLGATELRDVEMWHKVSLEKDKPSSLYYVELEMPQLRAAATANTGSSDGSATLAAAAAGGEENAVCPRSAVMAELHSRLVSESLRTLRFEASGAGLDCWQSPLAMRGMTLQCEGFSDTLAPYITSTLHAIRGLEPEQVAFDTQLEQLQRDYQDAAQGGSGASGLAYAYSDRMTYRIAFLPEQLEEVAQQISLKDVAAFADAAFADSSGKALVLGNINRTAAAAIASSTLEVVRAAGTGQVAVALAARKGQGEAGVTTQAVAKLEGKWHSFAVAHPNPDETNCAVLLTVQLGLLDRRKAATAIVLGDIVSQPFFSHLRTEQQLGYLVRGGLAEARGVYSLSFVVQSSVATPAHVTDSMHEFLNATMSQILANMEQGEFDDYVASAQQRLLQKPKSLSEEGGMLWARVADGSFDFGRQQELARLLANGTVTLDAVREMHQRTLQRPSKAAVASAVSKAAFATESAAVSGAYEAVASTAMDSAAVGAGRLLVWVLPKKGPAAAEMPTAKTAPADYTLVESIDDLRESTSYYPHPSYDPKVVHSAEVKAMAARLAANRPESTVTLITSNVKRRLPSIRRAQPPHPPCLKMCGKACCVTQDGRGTNARRQAALKQGYRHSS